MLIKPLSLALALLAIPGSARAELDDDFLAPPMKYRTKPLWFWNNTSVTPTGIVDQMQNLRDRDGYGGFSILPFGGSFTPKYLTDSYFDVYESAIAKADELGMQLCIYDEYGFPSGSAGAINGDGVPRFANAFPNDTIKRIDKSEADVTGPRSYTRTLPPGTTMACVAMNHATKERVDLSSGITGNSLTWLVPAGSWKIMVFTCVKDGDPNVDYLSPESCAKFVAMTHQKYFDRFPDSFGPDKTVDGVFFDEPTMYRAAGRMWTPAFNTRFEAKFGFSPVLLYPALWYDIGADTQAARNHLFGMRAELYATGYAKTVQDWCREHGNIYATGHQDQEEIVNPCNVSGDLMKCFEFQDIPGIDKIGGDRPAERFYKVVSSAADNYDKSHVMSETYGAMGNISFATMYQIVMDQYTKGINMIIPHAAWYDPNNVTFLPELSYRSPLYASGLAEYNRYVGRLNVLLQNDSRHIADIGMLYPIAGMQGGNTLDGPLGSYAGGVAIPEADYIDVAGILSDTLCRDFTYLHPDTIDDRCSVNGKLFNLNNEINFEQYKVLVIPGGNTIRWSNLQKIKSFYDNGGKVIATRQLPSKSAEFGHDADVVATVAEMFPEPSSFPVASASSQWAAGGYDPAMAADASMTSRWNAADGTSGNQWLEIDFGSPKAFERTVIKEAFNRITAYEIQYWDGAAWVVCSTGTTAGAAKTDSFNEVTASKVRLYIKTISSDSVSLYEFEVYNSAGENLAVGGAPATKQNANGGTSYFISNANPANMRQALDDALDVYDVEFENDSSLRYIHKFKDGRHLYFIANLSGASVSTAVKLRGALTPQIWDPHTGEIDPSPSFTHVTEGTHSVTRIPLVLADNQSLFVVATRPEGDGAKIEVETGEDSVFLNLSGLTNDRRYFLERSPDLEEWVLISDFIATAPENAELPAIGTLTALFDEPLSTAAAFYRLLQAD